MLNRLRIAASYLGLAAAIATAALWGYSYLARIRVERNFGKYQQSVESWEGLFIVKEHNFDADQPLGPPKIRYGISPADEHRKALELGSGWGTLWWPQPFEKRLSKRSSQTRDGRTVWGRFIALPHWFLVLVASVVTIATRPKPRWRFGLRDLMVLTSIVAVGGAVFAVF